MFYRDRGPPVRPLEPPVHYSIDNAGADRTCIGETSGQQGYIQSPNWPGLYPANVECTWRITPERGRRILVVIPEIYIAAGDKCQDSLVMRKSGKLLLIIDKRQIEE